MQSWSRRVAAAGAAVWLGAAGARAFQTAVSAKDAPAQPVKLPSGVFDEKADAADLIRVAREQAKEDNRLVLVLWGANNSEFCIHLNTLLTTDARIKRLVESEYELVRADIGKFERHLELAKNYKTDIVQLGVPDLTVIDPLGDTTTAVLPGRDVLVKPPIPPRVFDVETIFKFLDNSKPRQQAAAQLLTDAQAKAKSQGKRVLAYSGAWGCEPCAAWEKLAGSPEGVAVLGKAFVLRKIDTGRQAGADGVLKRLRGDESTVAPWITVLDGEGKRVTEAGKGVVFDPAAAAATLPQWLVATSGGKLNADDQAAITKLLSGRPGEPKKTAGADPDRK